MKYEVFERVIDLLKKSSTLYDTLYRAGLDVANISDDYSTIITHLIGSIYGDNGESVFSWWCYEKEWGTRTDLTMSDVNGNILCETMKDLYVYLEENKTNDYTIKPYMTDDERMAIIKQMFN